MPRPCSPRRGGNFPCQFKSDRANISPKGPCLLHGSGSTREASVARLPPPLLPCGHLLGWENGISSSSARCGFVLDGFWNTLYTSPEKSRFSKSSRRLDYTAARSREPAAKSIAEQTIQYRSWRCFSFRQTWTFISWKGS